MALNPFAPPLVPPPVAPPIASVVAGIEMALTNAGRNLLGTYQNIQRLIYANPFYSADQINAALGADMVAQLQTFAVLVKSVVNFVTPGTITDTVPTATITMPAGG